MTTETTKYKGSSAKHKFSYTHRGLLDRQSANIVFDLEFGDEVRITRDKRKPAEDELRGLMGVFTNYSPKGYAIIMLQDTRHPWAIDGKVSVHPEALIWLRHRGEMFDAYTDHDDAHPHCYCSSLADGRCDFCTGTREVSE